MTKEVFFQQLRARLRGLPTPEQQHIIRIYEDLFAQAEANGKSEQEITASLGFQLPSSEAGVPPTYAQSQSYNSKDPFPPVNGHRSVPMPAPTITPADSRLRMLAAAIALGLFNLIFVLWFFLAGWGVLLGLNISSFVFLLSPIWVLIGSGIPDSPSMWMAESFAALAMIGLGGLLAIGTMYANRGMWAITKRYVRVNMRLIRGE